MKIGYSNIYFTPVAFVTFSLIEQVLNKTNEISLAALFTSRKAFFIVNGVNGCNKFLIDFFVVGAIFRTWKNFEISMGARVCTNCQKAINVETIEWKCKQYLRCEKL